MSHGPFISVVIPTYNRARQVEAALKSVLAQTYSEFEAIIVDDGSTDRTMEILRSFRDSRIRVIQHAQNLGIVAALNRGLAEARGDLVARMDARLDGGGDRLTTITIKFVNNLSQKLPLHTRRRTRPGGT